MGSNMHLVGQPGISERGLTNERQEERKVEERGPNNPKRRGMSI